MERSISNLTEMYGQQHGTFEQEARCPSTYQAHLPLLCVVNNNGKTDEKEPTNNYEQKGIVFLTFAYIYDAKINLN